MAGDQVILIFDRKLWRTERGATPGRFRSRVITARVTPSLHIDYKHTTIKQYRSRADAVHRDDHHNIRDFGIGKRLIVCPPCDRSTSTLLD